MGQRPVFRGREAVSEPGVMVIGPDMGLKAQVRTCRRLEVYGAFEGELAGGALIVHRGGRVFGSVVADSADVHGVLEGVVRVKQLINIRASGSVVGQVLYGQLAMEPGANLSAEVRNVPPTVTGDFQILVKKGRSARVTIEDLTALDPDDKPEDLRFTVTRADRGVVVLADAPAQAAGGFSQADLAAGRVLFQHDGGEGQAASFEVIVTDTKGATSGAPRTVSVAVAG